MSHNLFKENYTGPIFLRRVFGFMNQSARFMNHVRGVGGCEVTPNEFGGVDISPGEAGINLRKFAFGWRGIVTKEHPRRVLIGEGWVEGRYGFIPVDATEVEVGGTESSKHYIIVEGDTTTAVIVSHSVSAYGFESDAANRWRRILYRVYLKNGRPVMDMIGSAVGGVVL